MTPFLAGVLVIDRLVLLYVAVPIVTWTGPLEFTVRAPLVVVPVLT